MARVILSEQTADRIRQLIDRQYKPGERIPAEMELAEFLGVSRTTKLLSVKIRACLWTLSAPRIWMKKN